MQASALSSSRVTSRNASMISACVETGAANTLHEKKDDLFQYRPSSSERTPRSLIDAMIFRANFSSPMRFKAMAASACELRPKSVHSSLRCLTKSFAGCASFAAATPLNVWR